MKTANELCEQYWNDGIFDGKEPSELVYVIAQLMEAITRAEQLLWDAGQRESPVARTLADASMIVLGLYDGPKITR